MSSLHMRELGPLFTTKSVASSKCEYSQGKFSLGIPSLMDDPCGCDRSMISLTDPSFFGADPIGEQWVRGNGG